MSNEIGTKKLDKPMDNPFLPQEPHGIATDEQEVAQIATDGRPDAYAKADEDALPEWFDPTNLSFEAGIGYSFYDIYSDVSGPYSEFYVENESFDSPGNDQFSTRIAMAYRPFVFGGGEHSLAVSFGVLAGYQATPSIGGHDVHAGLNFEFIIDKVSLEVTGYYTHLWANNPDFTLREFQDGDIIPTPYSYELDDYVADELSMHGAGSANAVNYRLTDHFKAGVYVLFNYYRARGPHGSDFRCMNVTPGIQAAFDL